MFSLKDLSASIGKAVAGVLAMRGLRTITPEDLPPSFGFVKQHTNAKKNAWRKLKRDVGARQARKQLKSWRANQRRMGKLPASSVLHEMSA